MSTNDLVVDVQMEILNLLSEKQQLQRENDRLKCYKEAYDKLIQENLSLKEEISALSGHRRILTKPRPEPDGQEDMTSRTRTADDI